MAKRSYVPRHAAVHETAGAARGATKAATVLAASVGVAAAATALANPANAAPQHHSVWDRVASCESGQRWHVDTGNGYYGGLQFSASTWDAYHGGKYASNADNATRMEQIQVARRVLKSQGRDAWPVCGPEAGLNKNNGDATATALPNDPTQMPGSQNHKARNKGYKARKTTLKSHHGTHKSHHGTHKSHHGTHKSHHGTHKSRAHHSDVYVVHRGDTLSSIAQKMHVHGGWHALYRANRARLHNPDVLHVGQHLLIP